MPGRIVADLRNGPDAAPARGRRHLGPLATTRQATGRPDAP
jgi:hypothetical protein